MLKGLQIGLNQTELFPLNSTMEKLIVGDLLITKVGFVLEVDNERKEIR